MAYSFALKHKNENFQFTPTLIYLKEYKERGIKVCHSLHKRLSWHYTIFCFKWTKGWSKPVKTISTNLKYLKYLSYMTKTGKLKSSTKRTHL